MDEGREKKWDDRLDRALALMAARLDDPPSLEALAQAACVSPFHFHRIWRAVTGEPVGQTVARLRIALAQQRLRDDRRSVTDVAMEGGFATPQSFARAFRRVSGQSPTQFLTGRAPAPIAPVPAADIRIELRAPTRLVALRRAGGGYEEMNALYWRIWSWAEAAARTGDLAGIYGMPLDDPGSVPADAQRYEAAMAFGPEADAPTPFHRIDLPGGPHACLRHRGDYQGLDAAGDALTAWLIRSGREPADRPIHHHFLNDPDETAPADRLTDVLLALQPQGEPR